MSDFSALARRVCFAPSAAFFPVSRQSGGARAPANAILKEKTVRCLQVRHISRLRKSYIVSKKERKEKKATENNKTHSS